MMVDDGRIRRVTRSKAEARANYDRLSRRYDALAGSSEKKLVDAGLRQLQVREGERVLEIGFGTGRVILTLARSVGDRGRVYGLDISEGMFRVAENRVAQAGVAQRVELRVGDAISLPLEAGTLDAIWMGFTLELFDTPEIPIVLAECRRVLHSGGRLGIVAMSRQGKAGLMLKLYEWAHDRLPRTVDCRPIYAAEAVRRAGLDVVACTLGSLWGLPVETVLARAR